MNTLREIDETVLDDFRPGYVQLLVNHLVDETGWSEGFTAAVIADGLRFLSVCAIAPSGPAGPTMVCSPIVDVAVDAIFLDTPLLCWLEQHVFGTRIQHVPAYAHGVTDPWISNIRYEAAIDLMRAAGYEVDRKVIWPTRLPVDYRPCQGGPWNDCQIVRSGYVAA